MTDITTVFLSPWLLLIVSGAILVLSLYIITRLQRQIRMQSRAIASLRNDLRAITAAAVGVGERVVKIERNQRQLSDRQELLDSHDSGSTAPYEQAIRMVQHGAAPEQLVQACGLSQNEAELISLMHRLDKNEAVH